jgi:choline dehydrogenase-like flavoprotein
MFLSPSDLGEQTELTCEVCIIGSGAAGITLARELASRRIDTICVSGGSTRAQTADQDLYRGYIPNSSAHEPLETNRARAFGGSTTVWSGRLVPFDPIDFETRDFLPLSGWPISYQDVARYIPRAAALCESRQREYELKVESDSNDLPATLSHGIVTNRCERWSMPTNFAERYSAELAQSDTVRVLIDQHCVDVVLDESHLRVQRVYVQSRGREPRRICARLFVLACGGLENARLLLASRRQMRRGIGNQDDMVGRCYMGHLLGTHGYLRLNGRRLPNFYRLMKDEHGMYMRRRFWLAEETQRTKKMMNIIAFPFRPNPEDPRHGDAALSLLYLAEVLSTGHSHVEFSTVARHLRNVMFTNPLAWATVAQQFWGRFKGSPRLPFLLPYRRKLLDAFYFQSEHAPNRESRVVLSDRVDEFGMPRLEPRIAFSEIDTTTIVQFYAILDRSLRELELGRIEYTESELRDYLSQIMQNYCSLAHHIGTTRMSANPRDGVVDSNCRVHGIENLYIAGSSVFATSGHANPTLTILALTLRLADCLVADRSEAKVSVA